MAWLYSCFILRIAVNWWIRAALLVSKRTLNSTSTLTINGFLDLKYMGLYTKTIKSICASHTEILAKHDLSNAIYISKMNAITKSTIFINKVL
jgi:hypothetical protein